MLIATMLAIPWWLAVPGYFLIGALWACFYLPRSIRLQAERYLVWRESMLAGRLLGELLSSETASDGDRYKSMTADNFILRRDIDSNKFSERHALNGFIANIALWPIRIPEKLLFDYFLSIWKAIKRFVRYIWRELLVPIWNWVYARVTRIYQVIISLANREAIADMEKLKTTDEGK